MNTFNAIRFYQSLQYKRYNRTLLKRHFINGSRKECPRKNPPDPNPNLIPNPNPNPNPTPDPSGGDFFWGDSFLTPLLTHTLLLFGNVFMYGILFRVFLS